MESIEEFYLRKFNMLPDQIRKLTGRFNIFDLEPFVEGKPTTIPYQRRDFFKVMLVRGNSKVHYADRVVKIEKQAITFSNPQIPYKWEHLDRLREGTYCIFDTSFFHQFGQFNHYEVFLPNGNHIFELTDVQFEQLRQVFNRIRSEFNSDYKYKFDSIRNGIFELIHFGLKLEPSVNIDNESINASQRITMLFLELLQRQFPIDDTHSKVNFRTASDFANQLNVHVNHLNRSVKEVTSRTTTQLITDRLLQESKTMLRHSDWNVSEISYALGFKEVTHFNNFFKKQTATTPLSYRKMQN
jgi:AraC-like DNA-binding protein